MLFIPYIDLNDIILDITILSYFFNDFLTPRLGCLRDKLKENLSDRHYAILESFPHFLPSPPELTLDNLQKSQFFF